jgi:hypothetical protein
MEMQRLRRRTAGARIRLAQIDIVRMGMSRCAVVVGVDLSLPDPGQEQAKQRNAEQ